MSWAPLAHARTIIWPAPAPRAGGSASSAAGGDDARLPASLHREAGTAKRRTGRPAAGGYSAPLTAAAVACCLANAALLVPPGADWLASWPGLLDAFLSIWVVLFIALLVFLWLLDAARPRGKRSAVAGDELPDPAPGVPVSGVPVSGVPVPEITAQTAPDRSERRQALPFLWAGVLLAICAAELLTHAGERNGFLASSRPTSGVERWTTADGYATLLDGIPAQGDGLFLLPMLDLFLGDKPPVGSDFDRRAGHVYLVSLLARLAGGYWAFAIVNLLSWWSATLAIWWLGQWRWPGTAVPWIASILAATGQGFIFMAAAPQAHSVAFAAFALCLTLYDALPLQRPDARARDWITFGWAAGAAGLIYLVHLPCLLFAWLHGLSTAQRAGGLGGRLLGLVLGTVTALVVVFSWQVYALTMLELRFSGGNNDLAGEAIARWLAIVRGGLVPLIDQLHAGSPRGILSAAFYYPWWILAVLGWTSSSGESRRWSLAVLVAAAVPVIAFSTRFHLPRVAYFMYPAVYLLAARGIETLAVRLTARLMHPTGRRPQPVAAAQLATMAITIAALATLTNLDLAGWQQLNVWFHYSQGNAW